MIKISLLYKGAVDFCPDQAYLTRVDKSTDPGLFCCFFVFLFVLLISNLPSPSLEDSYFCICFFFFRADFLHI